ncbi:HET-domain-containing protein [Xylaria grammica]|nr:HET-domain-containing protein [Xylaria grammica]
MRLLNVSTLDFKEVADPGSQKYAILSHTWEDGEEVSLQDWLIWHRKRQGWEDVANRRGLVKILGACKMTKEYNLDFLWIDTNCIDKLSSAEISEAINSMFKWYSLSTICLTYLSDINCDSSSQTRIRDSKWFTRGWTLQELLAPRQIDFFGYDWNKIGSRASLSGIISNITSIEEKYLDGSEGFRGASIAARMSWAASRQTSRIEDMAYSLLGIFEINMPLLYGEGNRAFIRLQEEILKVTTDQSIFAWGFVDSAEWKGFKPDLTWVSVLAPFPICFCGSGSVERTPAHQLGAAMEIWSMTNLGLTMHLPLLATTNGRRFFAVLQCAEPSGAGLLCIPVIEFNGELIRAGWPTVPLPLCRLNKEPTPVSVYLPRHHRYGWRKDVWDTPDFAQLPQLLVFITTSLMDQDIGDWITTPGAEFYPDYGVLSIVGEMRPEGAFISFNSHHHQEPKVNAVIFSKGFQGDILFQLKGRYAYCELRHEGESGFSWKRLWERRGERDASMDLLTVIDALSQRVTFTRTEMDGIFSRTNPGGNLEAVLNIRRDNDQEHLGARYSSVLIRAL